MKRLLTSFLMFFFILTTLSSQNVYQWNEMKISFNSPVKLQILDSSGSFVLSGNEMNIDIGTLGGMQGISGLIGSLDSYAKSFYSNVGAAESLNLKNLSAAKITCQKDGKGIILVMFATKDFKQHFVFEISFIPSKKTVAESIVKTIAYQESGGGNENNVDNGVVENDVSIDNDDDNNYENIDDNQNNSDVNNQTGMILGSVPPDFKLPDINDKSFNLSSLKGKIILLDFWGTWCGPCIKSIPEMIELYNAYKGNEFEMISIANDNDLTKWKNVVSSKGMNWINVIDLNQEICQKYSISAYPTLMLIGKNWKLVLVNTEKYEVEEYLKANIGKNISDNNTDDPINDNTDNNNTNQSIINPEVKNTHYEGNSLEKQTWQLLADYSGDGYIILDDFYAAPNEYQGISIGDDTGFSNWIDGTTEKDLVRSTNTVVHETCHGYTSKLYLKMLRDIDESVKDGNYSAYYLGNRKAKLVFHPDVFETKVINDIFPKELITDRYETYVYPSEPIMGSQQDGPYGLLDELNAYFWGTKVSFDFYEYYKTKYNSEEGWTDFFNGFYGTFYAYLEFKSYILVYMIYAKQNHPDIYNQVIQNKDFLYALQQVDQNWTNLIIAFNALKKTIAADLKKKGIAMSESEEFIYMGNSGSGNFVNIYNKFNIELKKEKYVTIAKALGLPLAGGPVIELLGN